MLLTQATNVFAASACTCMFSSIRKLLERKQSENLAQDAIASKLQIICIRFLNKLTNHFTNFLRFRLGSKVNYCVESETMPESIDIIRGNVLPKFYKLSKIHRPTYKTNSTTGLSCVISTYSIEYNAGACFIKSISV